MKEMDVKQMANRFFYSMQKFKKLNMRQLVPELSHMECVALQSIMTLEEKQKNESGVYVSDLVKMVDVAPSAVSRLLRELEKAGYVQRETDKNNRRNTFVSLTSEGKEIMLSARARMIDFSEAVLISMGEEKLNQFIELSDEFARCMEQELQKRKEKELEEEKIQ